MTPHGGAGLPARLAAVARVSAARMVPRLGTLRRWLPRGTGTGTGAPAGRRHTPTREQQDQVLREWEVLRERLHGIAQERLADVGDLLRGAEWELTPGRAEKTAEHDYLWAMEAYEAAGKLLDEAADLPDLAAAVVLADRALERFAAARTRHEGHRPPAPVIRCFYNPLHGAAQPASGGRGAKSRRAGASAKARKLSPRQAAADRRPACAPCRLAILAGQLPDVLPALVPVKVSRLHTVRIFVPYYAVPQAQSLWSATGCGGYGDESPALVLRGEHRRRRVRGAGPR